MNDRLDISEIFLMGSKTQIKKKKKMFGRLLLYHRHTSSMNYRFVDGLVVNIGPKFYYVPCLPLLVTLKSRSLTLKLRFIDIEISL